MELELTIGEVIEKLRVWLGISQENLARESRIDCLEISDIESGKKKIQLDQLEKISDYFNMSPEDLIDLTDSAWKLSSNTVELAEWLGNNDYEETVMLESPDYLPAIIGITQEGRLIYSYRKMMWYLIIHDGMDYETAVEFIDYNTISALNYMGTYAPMVIQDVLPF